GLGLIWSGTTGADGRFTWRNAPTNEVALAIAALDYPPRLVRLQASTNELLVILNANHNNGSAYVTGAVADAISGNPVEQFTVQVRHSSLNTLHNGQAAQGIHGGFSLTTSQSQVPVGTMPDWSLLVQADGYEPYATRNYAYAEGDQNLD